MWDSRKAWSMLEDGLLKIVQIDAQIGVHVHQHDLRAEVLDGAGTVRG
ncbi:MAG: hypothetical protein CM15mP79_2740 [Methanobacteriota archaeon]|nr:MAG: hypothetical protein CM15mP79_2740 [Euryarchaeota archaeon]